MKKQLFMITMLTGALALSACGGKETETAAASTEAVTEAAAETTEAATLDAESEAEDTAIFEDEGYFAGTVTGMTAEQINVVSDDGEAYVFDITAAETDPDYDILPGAYVEVSYDGVKVQDGVTPAGMVSVLMSLEQQAMDNGEDPALQGVVKEVNADTIIVTDPNGKDHEFDSSIAQIVSGGELAENTPVMVTYIGSIVEEIQEDSEDGEGAGIPIAIRIVTPESVTSEEASVNEIRGTVNYVDGGSMMIDTAAIAFEFTGDPSLFAGLSEGDEVVVSYTGSVGNKTISATAVRKAG